MRESGQKRVWLAASVGSAAVVVVGTFLLCCVTGQGGVTSDTPGQPDTWPSDSGAEAANGPLSDAPNSHDTPLADLADDGDTPHDIDSSHPDRDGDGLGDGGVCRDIDCDDGLACTLDTCDPELGCVHLPDDGACDDSNPCTDDACDPTTGCRHDDNDAGCDDGLHCTLDDRCADGICQKTSAPDCTGPCLSGVCVEGLETHECELLPEGTACDDENGQTVDDTCAAGLCVGCLPACAGLECGDDGCGGSCGDCLVGSCIDGTCVPVCVGGMCPVPAGTFVMGTNDPGFYVDSPAHDVWLDAFEIDETEVTVTDYAQCVVEGVCTVTDLPPNFEHCNWDVEGHDDHPMNCVTWTQTAEYCAWTGKRMCTEAEWEKAARGPDGRPYPWGYASPDCNLVVFDEPDGTGGCGTGLTFPVASKPPGLSPYGLYDMAGNVFEWVADWYDPWVYSGCLTDCVNPTGPNTGDFRVLRGGGFYSAWIDLRTSRRRYFEVDGHASDLGIRCCL